jgi:hypothetical protein
MAKAPSGRAVPYNGSSEYTIFLEKEVATKASITIDTGGNLTIEVMAPLGRRVQDVRDPPGSKTTIPKQATLTLKLK